MKLHLDVESRSIEDLRKVGAHRYWASPNTQTMMACWAIDDGPIHIWFPTEPCPPAVHDAVLAGAEVCAWNAQFERLCWEHQLVANGWPAAPMEQWNCVMARALACGLPGGLDVAAHALRLEWRKDAAGHRLMLRVSKPRRIDKDTEGNVVAVYWYDITRLSALHAYCRQDVMVERELDRRLPELIPREREVWMLDQNINDRGFTVNLQDVNAAEFIVNESIEQLNTELWELTEGQVKKVSDVAGIKKFLNQPGMVPPDPEVGPLDSLDKATVQLLLSARDDLSAPARRVLEIRQESGRSSLAKLKRMREMADGSGRIRGHLQYCGAASTGRWAGRGVQVQNLPRQVAKDLDTAIDMVRYRHASEIRLWFGSPLALVQSLLRPLISADHDCVLIGGDYAAIEARILAWLAGASNVLRHFVTGLDVYVTDARSVGSDNRQLGKVMRLALGFGMGAPRFRETARAFGIELSEAAAELFKTRWRENNPEIQQLWWTMHELAMAAVRDPGNTYAWNVPGRKVENTRISWRMGKHHLGCQLPSGRWIRYPFARVEMAQTPWGEMRPGLVYSGIVPGNYQWGSRRGYGGLLVENVVQAVARDVMAEAMLRLDECGFPVVLTVHDEVVCEVPEDFVSGWGEARVRDEFGTLMCEGAAWTSGLPLNVEAWTGSRYQK